MAHDPISRLATAILVLVQLTGAARAQQVHLVGAGANLSCGKWMEDRQSRMAVSVENWVLGYLSGAATWSTDLDPLNGLDADAVLHWLDNYCQVHPTERLTQALKAFVQEHPK